METPSPKGNQPVRLSDWLVQLSNPGTMVLTVASGTKTAYERDDTSLIEIKQTTVRNSPRT
jgi:hypothetical protein